MNKKRGRGSISLSEKEKRVCDQGEGGGVTQESDRKKGWILEKLNCLHEEKERWDGG